MRWVEIVLIGAAVGFLGGAFGKGGSAIATPLLAAVGVPAIKAVASPLPATIPGTLVAYARYRQAGVVDRQVVRWSLICGVPATVVGALLTHWISGVVLVKVTDVIVAGIGSRVLMHPEGNHVVAAGISHRRMRLAGVAVVVGFAAGLLANAGGFLLVPLYLTVLRLPIRTALGASLAVASVLAVPGTVVHAVLGHIDWTVTVVFGSASIPLSSLGARAALRISPRRLERAYGAGLAVLGVSLLLIG